MIIAELNLENLPEEWIWVNFEEIVENLDGQRVPVSRTERDKRDGQFPYYGASGIIDSIDKYLFDGDYLLIAEDGANLLSRSTPIAFEAHGKFWVNNHAHIIQCRQNAVPLKYLRYYLNSIDLTPYVSGSAQPKLNQKNLNRVPIPLPPVNEQRRIVEKVEALTTRSRKARAALDEIPALLDQFRQSVLAAAFRGDLTADWRAQNPNVEPAEALLERNFVSKQNPKQVFQEIGRLVEILPQGWTWTKLKTIIPHIQAGKNFSCPEVPVSDDTVGMVKISAVTWGRFNPRETKTVADESKIDPNLFIRSGDFLISRANTAELVGASVIVDDIQHRIMLSDKVWRVDFVNEIDKRYINLFLKSSYGRKEIESRATGNQLSMKNISQKLFQDIVIPLPPYQEQKAIADEIERLFHSSEKVKQQRYDTEIELAQLDQSILAKAFRGELVPQDPNDEPAAVLLDRIRAEREQLSSGKKRGKAKA